MSEPYITVRDPIDGETWEFQNRGACPNLEKLVNGDGAVELTYEFTQFVDRLPGDHANVSVYDDDGLVQQGRIVGREPPDTSLCTGPCRLVAEGDGARLGDRRFSDSTRFGPVWDGLSLALTPEAAIEYALSQNVSGVSFNPITATGFTIPDSGEDFLARTTHDVVNAMAAVSAGLATPYYWSVKKGVFRYQTLDLAPRYEVSQANGAIVSPRGDATRVYSRVLVVWGNGPEQCVSYPETLSYHRLPDQVDLVVNAGSELTTEAAALTVAQGLYAKLATLDLGWSWTVTIPGTTQIQKLFPGDTGAVVPWRVNAGYFLRVSDLDPRGRYGAKHPSPDSMLITHARWNGGQNQLVLTCGEMRNPSERLMGAVRQVMYSAGGSRVVHALQSPGLSIPSRDADRIPIIGPQSATATADLTSSNGQPTPQPIWGGIPAQSAQHQTIHPAALPPMAVVQQFHDADPTASGVKLKVVVPPLKAMSWTMLTSGIQTDYLATWTRRSNGATIASMDLAGSSLGEKIDQAIGPSGTSWAGSTVGLVETDDVLIYTVKTPASSTAVSFVDSGLRTVRHYTSYPGDAHPRTGVLKPS